MKTLSKWNINNSAGEAAQETGQAQDLPLQACKASYKPFLTGVSFDVLILLLLFLFFLFACAPKELPPPPPTYVYKYEERAIEQQPQNRSNSLWNGRGSLYGDVKAVGLNDIVTIRVVENFSGSGTADTSTSRESSLGAGIDNFFGSDLEFGGFEPRVSGSARSDFEGEGRTTRSGRLVGTITATVVEVLPNGNFVIESRKDLTVNNEQQILVLRGVIRPFDIGPDNTILSSRVANADIYLIGNGVIQDKQKPGWLVRIIDNVWPF